MGQLPRRRFTTRRSRCGYCSAHGLVDGVDEHLRVPEHGCHRNGQSVVGEGGSEEVVRPSVVGGAVAVALLPRLLGELAYR